MKTLISCQNINIAESFASSKTFKKTFNNVGLFVCYFVNTEDEDIPSVVLGRP